MAGEAVVVVDSQHAKGGCFIDSCELVKTLTRSTHAGNEFYIQLDRAAVGEDRLLAYSKALLQASIPAFPEITYLKFLTSAAKLNAVLLH